jgi:iron complex transport system permease protein
VKITLDVDRLLSEGKITQEECGRLKELASQETGSQGLNLLIGFGVLATTGGALALLRSAPASIALGGALEAAGIALSTRHQREWGTLGLILLLVGALTVSGGILTYTDGKIEGFLAVTAICAVVGIVARSGMLVAMAVIGLSACLGAATNYYHAAYELVIRQPALTVVAFTVLALATYRLALTLPPETQRLAVIASRTSLILVNFGFWVGSLWGDSLWFSQPSWSVGSGDLIPDWVFALLWAAALIGAGIWAVRNNRRWVVNTVAVFGAFHFYTQYFERLGASPVTMVLGGVIALAFAVGLARYNRAMPGAPEAAPS